MSEQWYLILSEDGPRACIDLVDRAGLEQHLAEASAFAAEGGAEPLFLSEIPTEGPGRTAVRPGSWQEGQQLILEVRVVVPQPVTVKWQIS